MSKFPKVLFAAAVCLSTGLTSRTFASDPSLPHTDELIKKFIQRSQEEQKEKLDEKYGFLEHRIHDLLDKNNQVKEHQDETFEMVMLEGHPFHRMIAKNGKPLTVDLDRVPNDGFVGTEELDVVDHEAGWEVGRSRHALLCLL